MVYSMSPDKYLKHKQGLVSLELLQTTSGVLTVGKALQAVQNHPEVELPFLHIQGHWLLMIWPGNFPTSWWCEIDTNSVETILGVKFGLSPRLTACVLSMLDSAAIYSSQSHVREVSRQLHSTLCDQCLGVSCFIFLHHVVSTKHSPACIQETLNTHYKTDLC